MSDSAAQSDDVRNRRVRALHVLLGCVHALSFAIAMAVASANALWLSFPVVFTHFSRISLTQDVAVLGHIDPALLAICASAPSAIGHFVVALSPTPVYEANRTRYIDYALSSPLMLLALAILSGLNECYVLIFLFACQFLLCLLGGAGAYFYQLHFVDGAFTSSGSKAANMVVTLASTLLHTLVWGLFIAALPLSGVTTAWVYALIISLFAVFSLFAVVDYCRFLGICTNDRADFWFLVLSASAKVYLQWLILGGALALRDQLNKQDPSFGDYVLISGCVLIFSALLTLLLFRLEKRMSVHVG